MNKNNIKARVQKYIPDKKLYGAVMWSRKMISEGTSPGLANYRAAKYYGFETGAMAHYTGQVASRIKRLKSERWARR